MRALVAPARVESARVPHPLLGERKSCFRTRRLPVVVAFIAR